MKHLLLILCTLICFTTFAQKEPEFIGEVMINKEPFKILDKEYPDTQIKPSAFGHKTFIAVSGSQATTRIPSGNCSLIVKCSDNASDPMTIISIYKLKSKGKKRSVAISVDNWELGALGSAKTFSDNLQKFTGKRYGQSSYEITLNLDAGEYGIIVSNPNAVDEKITLISCFGVD